MTAMTADPHIATDRPRTIVPTMLDFLAKVAPSARTARCENPSLTVDARIACEPPSVTATTPPVTIALARGIIGNIGPHSSIG